MTKIPEYIGAFLGRINRFVSQGMCFHSMHTEVSEDRTRVYTKCGKCLRETPGWILDAPKPRQTYPAVPGAAGVLSRRSV